MRSYGFEDDVDERGEERLDLVLRAALASIGLRLTREDVCTGIATTDSDR